MANIYNSQFIDAVDRLNKMAYMLVDGNAKAWASVAARLKIITYKDRARIEQLVDLRNSMGHGNAEYINVGQKAVNEVHRYIAIMNNTADRVKGHKAEKKRSTFPRGGESPKTTTKPTARQYYQEMYGYNYQESSSTPKRKSYQFVSAPPKTGLFGKKADGYGWVICNQAGEFLTETSYVRFSPSFDRAVVFETESAAKKQIAEFSKDATSWGGGTKPFFRIRCVKLL